MKKRLKKIRGTRTCGGGSAKKRRGKGSKGGSGNAGSYTHHILRTWKKGIFKGQHGTATYRYSPGSSDDKVVNVGDLEEILEELLETGKAEEKDDGIHLDANEIGMQKLLGKGEVTNKLMININANKISKRAQEKIELAGGKVCII